MNSQERLESHKRMYSWIEEQAKRSKCLDEDNEKDDWETLSSLYPELLMLIEDLIRDLELVNPS